AVLDCDVASLNMAGLAQALAERAQDGAHIPSRRLAVQKADYWHSCLLRARRGRPRGTRAAEKRYELASLHSITSSAAACRVSGTLKPSALAACKLMTSSNFAGCMIGRSLG